MLTDLLLIDEGDRKCECSVRQRLFTLESFPKVSQSLGYFEQSLRGGISIAQDCLVGRLYQRESTVISWMLCERRSGICRVDSTY